MNFGATLVNFSVRQVFVYLRGECIRLVQNQRNMHVCNDDHNTLAIDIVTTGNILLFMSFLPVRERERERERERAVCLCRGLLWAERRTWAPNGCSNKRLQMQYLTLSSCW